MIIREDLDHQDRIPFRDRLDGLGEATRARIQARVLRFETGNLGDHKHLDGGVWEARVMFGPGYRLYFGKEGDELVLLLIGGDKGSQRKDIAKAAVESPRLSGHFRSLCC